MIVVDTTVLVYAVGGEHPLRDPCRRLVAGVGAGIVDAITTIEVIQEFVHIRAGRRSRTDATGHGRSYARLLAPLLRPTVEDLVDGLSLFQSDARLGAFDAVLAAAAVARGADALVSADEAFAHVPGLVHLVPDAPQLADMLSP